ncbi:MAG: MrcB family domain-containing protein [Flavobacteriales bacterium]|jgi:5-methylcytosine-specific restriction protein B
MSIPKNINKEHLLEAIRKIDTEGIPSDAASQFYDVVFNGKRYPPKVIVSYANLFANGSILDRNEFSGGINTQCFRLLEENGFEINIKKNEVLEYPTFDFQLTKFLEQAQTSELGTAHYADTYEQLKVKVSFGQGNVSRIPWIAFLSDYDTVQNGIYPLYLYYKEQNLLILAYGVSETNAPTRSWSVSNPLSISRLFEQKNWGKPARYGNSLIYQTYEVAQRHPLDRNRINKDLFKLTSIYKSTLPTNPNNPSARSYDNKAFFSAAKDSGIFISDILCTRFSAALLTKPFVILTGLSGSGKTKLAQSFAQWICKDKSQYALVPVGSDWTNREPLLGYPNSLQKDDYRHPDSGVLQLIIHALDHPNDPHFLILDEMNLSHVERYFADFLSAMESGEEISLHGESGPINKVPSQINVPSNLFIIGTVNIDETTHMFSPKVLDRANTIEFRITSAEMKGFLDQMKNLNLSLLKANGAEMGLSFLEMARNKSVATPDLELIKQELMKFFDELKKNGAEFGYRSASEILRLISQLTILDNNLSTSQKIDFAIMQKMLPKLHGSRRKIGPVLETLGSFCVSDNFPVVKEVFEKSEFDFNNNKVKYPLSLEKISRMYQGAIANGYTSFAEA